MVNLYAKMIKMVIIAYSLAFLYVIIVFVLVV
ncbi:hypothetical protein SAMN05428975_2849 [Mucilaginibacter sp. OK268]|nr:hypothetical protein SAMN05428975_2849 [Mucilaginibacter sp. OK268]